MLPSSKPGSESDMFMDETALAPMDDLDAAEAGTFMVSCASTVPPDLVPAEKNTLDLDRRLIRLIRSLDR